MPGVNLPTHVVIDNMPTNNVISQWSPILIALFALMVSMYSIYLVRQDFIDTHRPYLSVQNFASLGRDNKAIFSPEKFGVEVGNAPAVIENIYCKFTLIRSDGSKKLVDESNFQDLVFFPSSRVQEHIYRNPKVLDAIKSLSNGDHIERYIIIKYGPLSSKQRYIYEKRSSLTSGSSNWTEDGESSS